MTLCVENTFFTVIEESGPAEKRSHSAPPRLQLEKGRCADREDSFDEHRAGVEDLVGLRSLQPRARRGGSRGQELEPEGEPEWQAQAAGGEGDDGQEDAGAQVAEPVHFFIGEDPGLSEPPAEEVAVCGAEWEKKRRTCPQASLTYSVSLTGLVAALCALAFYFAIASLCRHARLSMLLNVLGSLESSRFSTKSASALLSEPQTSSHYYIHAGVRGGPSSPIAHNGDSELPHGSVHETFLLAGSLQWAARTSESEDGPARSGISEAFYASEGFAWLGVAEEMAAAQMLAEAASEGKAAVSETEGAAGEGASVTPTPVVQQPQVSVVSAEGAAGEAAAVTPTPPIQPLPAHARPVGQPQVSVVSAEEISTRRMLMKRQVLAMREQGYEVLLTPPNEAMADVGFSEELQQPAQKLAQRDPGGHGAAEL